MKKEYNDVEELVGIASSEPEEVLSEAVSQTPDSTETDDSRTGAQKVIEALRDDDEEGTNITLRTVLGGDIFSVSWLKRNLPFFILIMVMLVLYITNRYSAQKEMIRIDTLKKEVSDARNRATSRSSQLLQLSRESRVASYLRHTSDSTLSIASQPPYTIINDLPDPE